VDRHASPPHGSKVAIRWLGRQGEIRDLTYAELRDLSDRFALVLRSLGVGAGDRVFALCGRIPELYVAAMGTLKNRSIFCPLFSAFGPEPIEARLSIGRPKVLVTTAALYRRKVQALRARVPFLEHVLVVDEGGGSPALPNTADLPGLLRGTTGAFTVPPTDPEDPALLHFTSGTTGRPKGALHVHAAVAMHHRTAQQALDLREDDVFWCTADPGWVTGTSYGIIAPLTNRVTSIVDAGDFDAERWYRIIQEQRVTVWYTAPTAIRMLMKAGTELARRYDLSSLRFLASVGEPLNAEAVHWSREAYGLPFHDNWWQTETGGIMIANTSSLTIREGSMGKPLPGVEAAVVRRTAASIEVIEEPNVQGELALRPGWPSMFRAYWGEPERYARCFSDGWYLTGDLVKRDADGYFWFVGRADDVIKTSGHLVGPFEVESALLEHPAVAEAGVVGRPDPVAGETIKAFVSLRDGFEPGEPLRRELLAHARRRLGAAIAPKEIAFLATLPKTRSGKIMRRLLKARDLGLPEGDTSTLEGSAP
jgi:acetyl-CoA synthetase